MYPVSRWFTAAALFVLLGLFASGAAYGASASGYCYLEGETNHAGTKVDFIPYPFGEVFCYTEYTNASGHYSQPAMWPADYDVIFSHPCFITDGLSRVHIVGDVILPPVTLQPVSCCDELDWHEYPYYPPGTSIHFPADEGRHPPPDTNPVEWWYVNFHLTGQSTGTEYGAFAAFFKIPPMRLFSISDLHQQETYTNAKCVSPATIGQYYLNLEYVDELLSPDVWRNMKLVEGDLQCDGDLMPFTYRLHVDGQAEQGGSPMELDVIMSSTKAPMIVGGDGLIHVGNDSSYYYSHTKVKVLDDSEITVHGLTEKVSGYAWIDHQWGDFLLDEPLTWEWFSIKLDDSTEIMVADAWEDDERVARDSSQFNYFDSECSLRLSDEYTIAVLDRWQDEVSDLWFATKWRIREPSNQVDLIVTADYDEQVMRILDTCYFPHACFWEGVCSVTGTIGGLPVSGKAYAELTHATSCSCDYVGRCSDDMNLYYHEEDPPTYYYTEETSSLRDGEGGVYSAQHLIWFLMDMAATETRCHQTPHGWMCGSTQQGFGLIACYDPTTCDTLYTIRLPEYGWMEPNAEYFGLAYEENDGSFWYCRPIQPMTIPPSPPRTTIYHIDGSGNELGSFVVVGHFITGLAFDADHDHLWCIAQGDPDMLLEYDVSLAEPELLQGPFPVPSWAEDAAAGLEYDEDENALVAVNADAKRLMYFCDTLPGYPGPPGPTEPGVSPINSCAGLLGAPWGVALCKGTESVFIASSPGPPFPLDEYTSLTGCPGKKPIALPVNSVAEDDRGGLQCSSHPNPFNPATAISYVVPSACYVEAYVFNVLGQKVTTLVDEYQAAGHNSVIWDGTDKDGNRVASGVYFYQIKAGDLTETKKMILMK